MKKILITGITGFVGSHLADFILENKEKIKIFGLIRYHLSRKDNINHILNKLELVDCDLLDTKATFETIKQIKPDIIFHMAAQSFVSPSWKHPNTYMDGNYKMTVNLFDACLNANINPIIHIPGSGEEYGEISKKELPITENTLLRPVNPYAVTKIAQDYISYVYYRSYGMKIIRTRAFNHEGSRRDKVFGLPMYANQLAKIEAGLQSPVIITGILSDKRNLTHIKDMVRAYWLAVNYCNPGELYIVGNNLDNLTVTYEYLLKRMLKITGNHKVKYRIDKKFIRPVQVPRLICDASKFYKITKWKPKHNLDDIILDTLNYWRDIIAKN